MSRRSLLIVVCFLSTGCFLDSLGLGGDRPPPDASDTDVDARDGGVDADRPREDADSRRDADLDDADLDADQGDDADLDEDDSVDADFVDADLDDEDEPADADLDDEGEPADADADGHEIIRVECEAGTLVGEMERVTDIDAFAGIAVHGAPGSGNFRWNDSSSGLPPSRVEIPVDLVRGGDYYLWVRAAGPGGSMDALYVGFDVSDLRRFWPPETGLVWHWVGHSGGGAAVLLFSGRPTGPATVIIGPGEEQARCDRVILTTDPTFVPTEAP